ncbi:methyltransferase domain-containing protein [Cyanobium sp. Morenito 9A2]|uniref:class I SAM-dependent methyltransferase n=1 Tax=Cyanobium sp. Morenito 9A2 TaxID=2823718 RepID=UPI0020CD6422|nr:methyltransferase domain-containing protein [Cyanobium sp. Morenito 9A2]MCP9849798.1 methyltransferase domain-containing protein [Cyanobium sp. Morenito 9A2]
MSDSRSVGDYGWSTRIPTEEAFLLAPLAQLLPSSAGPHGRLRLLDLGCGNGWLSGWLAARGFQVVGVDPSASGITEARRAHPELRFEPLAASPQLLHQLGEAPFDLVVSLEVVEHCYAPRDWAAAAFSALRPGGQLIVSTPYHGYLKNLALAGTGQLEAHFTALWDGGHIKFWSRRSLGQLLTEAGFEQLEFRGAGRLPWLWKSMVLGGCRG